MKGMLAELSSAWDKKKSILEGWIKEYKVEQVEKKVQCPLVFFSSVGGIKT